MKRTIRFYRTASKKCPVEDFLDSLSGKVVQKTTWVLSLIEDLEMVPKKYFEKLEDRDIWECRISFAGNIYRILCFLYKDGIVVLTNGFMKKTRKTPPQEIKTAENYRDDFINNGGFNR